MADFEERHLKISISYIQATKTTKTLSLQSLQTVIGRITWFPTLRELGRVVLTVIKHGKH